MKPSRGPFKLPTPPPRLLGSLPVCEGVFGSHTHTHTDWQHAPELHSSLRNCWKRASFHTTHRLRFAELTLRRAEMPTGSTEAAGGATFGEAGRRVRQHWECRMRCHRGSTCACAPQAKLLAGQVADALATKPISGSREGHQKRLRKEEKRKRQLGGESERKLDWEICQ